MHTALRFNAATAADVPELVLLMNRAYRGEAARSGWTHEADLLEGERTNAGQLTAILQQSETLLLKGTDGNGSIRACVLLQKKPDHTLYLGMLTVDPQWQNSGIGKQLLQLAEVHARKTGCSAITVTVLTDRTELIAWYRRHGYEPKGSEIPFPNDTSAGIPLKPLTFITLQKKVSNLL